MVEQKCVTAFVGELDVGQIQTEIDGSLFPEVAPLVAITQREKHVLQAFLRGNVDNALCLPRERGEKAWVEPGQRSVPFK